MLGSMLWTRQFQYHHGAGRGGGGVANATNNHSFNRMTDLEFISITGNSWTTDLDTLKFSDTGNYQAHYVIFIKNI